MPPDANDRMQRNVSKVLGLGFFQVFLVIMPIAVPFFQSKGLSMQDVFTLQAVFGSAVLLMEVPSGYVADLIGRKSTLVVGAVFSGTGQTLLILADGFWGLAAFELALAVSYSLISGADLALLYDSELALKRSEADQSQVVGRLYSARTLSETAAALACSALLLLGTMQTVVYVQAFVGWVPLALAILLVEPERKRMDGDNHLQNVITICRHVLNGGRVLRLSFLALCVWSLTTFYAVWLLQKLWELQQIDIRHFGYLWAGLSLVATAAGRWAHAAETRFGAPAVLMFAGLAPALGYVSLIAFGPVGGVLASATFFAARGFGLVLLRDALNRRVPSEFRATANSLASFGFRAGFVLTGSLVGHVLDLWGMNVVLLIMAVFTLAVFFVLVLPLIAAVGRIPFELEGSARAEG